MKKEVMFCDVCSTQIYNPEVAWKAWLDSGVAHFMPADTPNVYPETNIEVKDVCKLVCVRKIFDNFLTEGVFEDIVHAGRPS